MIASIAPSPAKVSTLSGALAELVLELALALHKRGLYPTGHPLLQGAVESLYRRTTLALEERTVLSLGIAGHQLIVEGVATDVTHPLVAKLAAHLHEHELAALRFLRGVTREELDDMLTVLAVSATRVDRPLGALGEDALSRWRHIALFPASLDRLELASDGRTDGAERQSAEAHRLWTGLARAALSGLSLDDADDENYEPQRVAGAINARKGEQAYEQVVIGYFLQIASELRHTPAVSAESAGLVTRLSKLISSLSQETLTRLMEMGGDAAQRDLFVKHATDTLTANAVLDLVRASATASKQPISEAMLRMLGKLTRNAGGASREAANADKVLRSQVKSMLDGWTLDDPNPDGYSAMLGGIGNLDQRTVADTLQDGCEPERVVEISVHCGTLGAATEQAIARWIARDGLAAVLDALTALPTSEVRDLLIDGLVTGPLLGEQLAAPRPDVRVLEHAVTRLRVRATEPLLAALNRRNELDALWISDLLLRTGADGLAHMARTLMQRSAKSQRVLLGLLERGGLVPSDADLDQLANADDDALRREALRLLIKQPNTHLMGVVRAIKDRDEKTVAMGLANAPRTPSPMFVSVLIVCLTEGTDWNVGLRTRAIRTLAATGSDAAVQWMTQQILTRHWLFRTETLRKATAESVACVSGLAAHWAKHPAAAAALRLAGRSKEAAYAEAVRRAVVT